MSDHRFTWARKPVAEVIVIAGAHVFVVILLVDAVSVVVALVAARAAALGSIASADAEVVLFVAAVVLGG